jgi:hypothetical protein
MGLALVLALGFEFEERDIELEEKNVGKREADNDLED